MKASTSNAKRLRAVSLSALTLLLVLGMIFILPQGQVWANNILRFFIPGSDQISLPTPQPVKINPANLTPDAAQPTLTPIAARRPEFYAACGDIFAPRCSIEQIQKMVDFPVKGIADLPVGLQFLGGTGGPDGVSLYYWRDDPISSLLLTQGPATQAEAPIPVGKSAAIQPVQIGNVSGEYVKGTYFSYGGDTEAQWNPNADSQSLRWEEQGMLYTMWMTGSAEFPDYSLDMAGMVRLAASLTDQAAQLPAQPTHEAPKTVRQVEQEAGFKVIEPAWLPEGYRFERAGYFPNQKLICNFYHHPADVPMFRPSNPPAPSLSIAFSAGVPLPGLNDLMVEGLRPDQILLEQENLKIGGALQDQGQYAYGSLNAGKMCGTESNQNELLSFQAKGLNIAIIAQAEGPAGGTRNWLTRQEMVRLAESITGVQALTGDQPDPQFLTSLDEARQMASFPLILPAKSPEGMNFDHAQVSSAGAGEKVTLYFSAGNQIISISQTKGSPDTLDTIYQQHPEAYHQISIHNQPALLTQGYWDENGWKEIANGGDGGASVTWFEDGIEYSVGGFNAYPSAVWIEIADSMK